MTISQGAGQSQPMHTGEGGREALQQLTPQIVKSFGVFFHTPQAALRFITSLEVFGVAHTQGEQSTLGVGKRAHRLNDLLVLVADSLEVERAVFGRGQQSGDAVRSLSRGDVDHDGCYLNSD
nr:hypothetical protein [Hydrogenophaga sp.]